MPAMPKEICGPDHCHNKKEMQWTPKLVPKEAQKEDFKNFKEESWNCFSLSWNGTRYWFWESVNSNYCRRKAYQLEKANNVNRGDRDKKVQPSRKSTLTDGMWNWPHLGHLHWIYQNLTATGVEVSVRIRRRMKVQLRNKMLVQCSSEFFITLLIDADEDCLVQSKRMATKYIIFFWYHQQLLQLFSHNWQ